MSQEFIMDIEEIKKSLPHRYPFLLVDRVLSCEPGKHLVALKNVTANEAFFQGHFPIKAVMPGVLIIEALAQTAGLLAVKSCDIGPDDNALYFLAGIDNARFKRVVVPGDQLIMHAEVIKGKRDLWKLKCEAYVDGDLACSAEIMSVRKGGNQ